MDHIIALLVAGVGAFIVAINLRRFSHSGQKAVWFCFWAHVAGTYAHIWLTINVLGGGDIFSYERYGLLLSDLLTRDFASYSLEIINLYFQRDGVNLPVFGVGSSTGSQVAVVGALLYLTANSFYATNLIVSLLAFSGQVAIYLGLREVIRPAYHKRLQIACLLVPSVIFWSAAVQKEAIALAGLGWVFLALMRFAYGKMHAGHVLAALLGAILVANSKAYILIALVAGGAAAFYWRRSQATSGQNALVTKPLYLGLALVIALVGMIVLGELFPRFSIQNFAAEAASLQTVGQRVEGGSNYIIVDPDQSAELGLTGQLLFAPIAVFTSLFRPLIVEVHNTMSFINALETTAIVIVFIKILRARPWRQSIKMIMSSPPMMFCLVVTMILALGVGLTTTNMGTLSRYRMPMMPFYITLLLMLLPLRSQSITPQRRPSRAIREPHRPRQA